MQGLQPTLASSVALVEESLAELKTFCPGHKKELFFSKSVWLGPLGWFLPLSVTLSASCNHPGDSLIAQKVEQLFPPALFCWISVFTAGPGFAVAHWAVFGDHCGVVAGAGCILTGSYGWPQ